MLMDYLVRCGVILQLVPPAADVGAQQLSPPVSPAAVVEQAFTEPLIHSVHTVETVAPTLDELSIDQILKIRQVTNASPLNDAQFAFPTDNNEFEEILRLKYGPETEGFAQPGAAKGPDVVSLLRESSETLDRVANQMERERRYVDADALRDLSERLRRKARILD